MFEAISHLYIVYITIFEQNAAYVDPQIKNRLQKGVGLCTFINVKTSPMLFLLFYSDNIIENLINISRVKNCLTKLPTHYLSTLTDMAT